MSVYNIRVSNIFKVFVVIISKLFMTMHFVPEISRFKAKKENGLNVKT